MTPVIAIVGRPNVGKSTLFNYLTQTRAALVADLPGVTRDRQYGQGHYEDKNFIVIDTGGIEEGAKEGIQSLMTAQTWAAIEESNIILFVVDGRQSFTPSEQMVAQKLRQLNKSVYVVVNKTDGLDPEVAAAEFYALGLPNIFPIAAIQGRGIGDLLDVALAGFSSLEEPIAKEQEDRIKIAIVGRPNAGKSTLVNRILGEERVIVYDQPGTTRDSIFIPFERHGKDYTLIDTAGVRRRRSIHEAIEKFSVVKTLQAIENANVVVFVVDAREGIAEQDLHILGFIINAGKALVIAINKWDNLETDKREEVRRNLDRRLTFVDFARIHYISALHGSGVGDIFTSINEAYHSATQKLSTPQLTDILEKAVESHQPPAVQGRRIKLRYAHVGGYNPPVIVIHGNQVKALPDSYKRYLANFFRKALDMAGTPIDIELRSGKNPFEERKNVLTERQTKRRKRLMQHVKKSKK